ncbi:hypothetical [Klebsormidium nitens]|uniref:Major capsid protein n=1 Tax=Klebsormidium nitens TaxID=105231 RepID=A0A1Y1IQZ1_KLENI|nr:hypothetical [Klebsormidium nitens]|eukprot:GAQ92462.1 hypothetical [Klebsormidium nitens]
MSGGLLSLVAQGAQDAYLTGSPQITFFRIVYRRYTNFALEAIEQTFNGAADFGRRVTATISRNGDLVTNMYLQVTLPALTSNTTHTELGYINAVGHALMRNVEVEIGGQKIDKIPSEYMEIYHQLSMPEEKRRGYGEMIGAPSLSDTVPSSNRTVADTALLNQNTQRTLYIPLIFWFNRVPGNALPLIALQYHEIKVNIEFRPLNELYKSNVAVTFNPIPSIVSASLYVDYVYLDTDERRKYASSSHEFLIEQLQFTGSDTWSGGSGTSKIRMSFNHPVKELIWTVTPSDSATADPVNGNLWFDCGEQNGGTDLMTTAKILLNGHDRFQERAAPYFRLVQPYQHHTRIPNRFIYVYSFALKPEEHQPSGTCNFSRIDNAALHLGLNTEDPAKISVYAVNYNISRITSVSFS